jgi:peptide-methionine (S)-S-oxide reductase
MRYLILIALSVLPFAQTFAEGQTAPFPSPAQDIPLAAASSQRTAVFAGGCFWGVQDVFEHVKGVIKVTAGYAGGAADTASYHRVSLGNTGHSESVEVVYDPSQLSYGELLQVFFGAAHNPMQKNRQGPDIGTQYKSRIFAVDGEQQRIAESYIAQLTQARIFPKPIVTEVTMLPTFYPAEAYHQDHAKRYPAPYILAKVERLKTHFPGLYRP